MIPACLSRNNNYQYIRRLHGSRYLLEKLDLLSEQKASGTSPGIDGGQGVHLGFQGLGCC